MKAWGDQLDPAKQSGVSLMQRKQPHEFLLPHDAEPVGSYVLSSLTKHYINL